MNTSEILKGFIGALRIDRRDAVQLEAYINRLEAEHREEVEGLVEKFKIIESILDRELGDTDPYIGEDWTDEDVREEEPLVFAMWKCIEALAPYHEVPCEACGGSGDRSIGEDVNGNEMVEPCPTCKGKGNVWRKKG